MNENLKTIRTAYEEEYKGTLDIKTYIKINEAFSNLLTRTLFNGRKVTLPYHLGTVEIIGKKLEIKRNKDGGLILPVDWHSTKKLWERDEECR